MGNSEENFERNFLKEVPKIPKLREKYYLKEQEDEDPYGFKLANQNTNKRTHLLSDRAHLVRNKKLSIH